VGFRFSLSSVLRIRESVERQEELWLQQAEGEVTRVQREIDELGSQLARAAEQRKEALKKAVPAYRLHAIEARITAASEQRDCLLNTLQAVRDQRDARMKVYQLAHRNRQTMDDLRGQEQTAWIQKQNKTEQKRLDDIFAARWQRE
jgi:flagellar export protein FliJ